MSAPKTPSARLARLARRSALLAAALATLSLSGCSLLGQFCQDRTDAGSPQVSVDGDRVSVRPDPLRFKPSDGAVTIRWRLPANGPFSFDEKTGIVIEDMPAGQAGKSLEPGPARRSVPAAEVFSCQRTPGAAHEFTCLNRNSGYGEYKYTINVRNLDRPLPPLDPRVVNEWNNY